MIVGVKARLTPKLLNSTVIVGNPLVAAAAAGDRHRKFAACEKARGLPVHRHQVRLGQIRDEALLREGVDHGADRLPKRRPTMISLVSRSPICRRVVGLKTQIRAELAPIDPDLAQAVRPTSAIRTCRLTWFGVATRHPVDDLRALDLAGDRGGERPDLFGLAGVGGDAAQHQVAVDRLGRDPLARRQLPQGRAQPRNIVLDPDRRVQQHAVAGVDRIDHGLARRFGADDRSATAI